MKQNFKDQFTNLREILKTNVETLRGLLKQSEELSCIIQQLNGDADPTLKHQLEKAKEQISNSINTLVDQTDSLFKVYQNLVEQIFRK